MADRTKKIELKLEWPFEYRGKTVDTVFIRRPKGADSHLAPSDPKKGGEMFPFIAALVSLPGGENVGLEFIDELDLSDLGAINEVIGGFQTRAGQSRAASAK
jgi:hypothetical protein